jgi:hypothetical protein
MTATLPASDAVAEEGITALVVRGPLLCALCGRDADALVYFPEGSVATRHGQRVYHFTQGSTRSVEGYYREDSKEQ